MVAGAQGGGYAIGIWMPTYLRTVRGISRRPAPAAFLLMQILGALCGFLIGSYLSDAIGRKRTFLWSAIGSLVHGAGLHVRADGQRRRCCSLGVPLNIVLLMKFPPMGPFMTELFPTEVRGNAQGFCYNAGRAIGSFFPTMVGFLSQCWPLGTAIAMFSVVASGIMIVMLMLLPETRGRSIAEIGSAGRRPPNSPRQGLDGRPSPSFGGGGVVDRQLHRVAAALGVAPQMAGDMDRAAARVGEKLRRAASRRRGRRSP